MAASDVQHPLTDEIFHELAVATWGHLNDDSDLNPLKMPTRSDLEAALRDGYLDDAIPEFNYRIGALLKATDLGPDMPVINTGKPLTPLVVPGLDMMNLIDKTPTEIVRFFIAANFDDHHDLWYEAKQVNQKLKHPIAPFVEEWFKHVAPEVKVRHPNSEKNRSKTTFDMSTSFTEELFQELAASTWRQRIRQGSAESTPDLPSLATFRASLMEGELDEGLPEFHRRISDIENVNGPDNFINDDEVHIRMEGRNELYVVAHGNKIKLDPALIDRTSQVLIAYELEECHQSWAKAIEREPDLKHPIAPLIEQWFRRPIHIEQSSKRVGILPISMESAGALGYLPGFAPEEAPLGNQEGLGMLPGFAPVDGTIIPGALVQTWAAGGGKMVNRGRGAPVPLRIWFGLLTSIPHEARRVPGRKRLEMTLRDLRDLVYFRPEGSRHHFNPKRDIARMRGDLWEVDQIRIRTMLPGYKAPGLWRPVGVTLMPEAHLDSPIVFDIELPPGSVGGAMIDRSAMRYFGVKSAPQYAAAIGLPYYWDKFGTHRHGTRPIQATRPKILRNKEGLALCADGEVLLDQRERPVAGFNDERLVFLNKSGRPVQGRTLAERRRLAARERNPYADRYPALMDQDILTLCFPADAAEVTGNLRFQRLHRAKQALQAMEKVGYCVIEPATGELGERAYRILPTDWSRFSEA